MRRTSAGFYAKKSCVSSADVSAPGLASPVVMVVQVMDPNVDKTVARQAGHACRYFDRRRTAFDRSAEVPVNARLLTLLETTA